MDRGYWLDVGPESECHRHHFDRPLAQAIADYLPKGCSIADFGSGNGSYVKFFREQGFDAVGYEGNPNASQFPFCSVLDLSQPVAVPVVDWVVSLEVGEHIPPQFEATFLANLDSANRHGVILSWAVPEFGGGHGHFNERPNMYITARMCEKGYVADVTAAARMRAVAAASWFHGTVMVFKRVETAHV